MDIKLLLKQQALNFKDKPAIIFEGNKITFSILRDNAFKLANYLKNSKIQSQDKLAIFLPNSLEAVFSFLGSFSLGLTVIPLDYMLTESEVINFINHSQAKVLIIQPKKSIDLRKVKNSCLSLKEIITCSEEINGFKFWDKVVSESISKQPEETIDEENLSSIFYTSGSTGHPKGVMLTYAHLNNPSKVIDYFLKISKDDIFLCGGVPFSHVGGLDYILLMVYFGTTVVLMPRFQPFEFLNSIQNHKVTIFCIVPAMYIAILSLKECDKFDLSSLRFAVVFGAPASPVLLKRFRKVYPNACLSNGWGMTETAAPNTLLSPGSEIIQSIGKFNPEMQAKIVDEQGNRLKANQQGELWVKGEAVMVGYYKQDSLTKQVLTEDKWLKTGDIAYFDEQGLFYIVGRKKEMIKVAGEVVFCAEVEERIIRHPKVKEVAVVGVADSLRGEVPKAFIVAEENEKIEAAELKEFLKKFLAHFKIPRYFEFVDFLPKNRTGKVDKSKLV